MLNMSMFAVFQFWKFWVGTPCTRNSCLSWCWCGGSLKVFWKSFCSTTSLSTSSSKVLFRWIDCGPICCLTSFSPIWNEKCPFAAPSYHASEVVEWWLVWSTSWIWSFCQAMYVCGSEPLQHAVLWGSFIWFHSIVVVVNCTIAIV